MSALIIILLLLCSGAVYGSALSNLEDIVRGQSKLAGESLRSEDDLKNIPHYSSEEASKMTNNLASKSESDLKIAGDQKMVRAKEGRESVSEEIVLKTAERKPLNNMEAHQMFGKAKKIYENPLETLQKLTRESCKNILNNLRNQYTKHTIYEDKKDIVYEEQFCERPNEPVNCEKFLTVTCKKKEGECDAGGIEKGSIGSGMSFEYNHPSFYIGTPYWEPYYCSLDKRDTTFKINNLKDIKEFTLNRVRFDDHLLIKVNDKQVYIGPDGYGNTLKVIRGTRRGVITTDGHNRKVCERSTNWDRYPAIDLRPFLQEGQNTISTTLVTAGHGNAELWITARQWCCSEFEDNWSKRCG